MATAQKKRLDDEQVSFSISYSYTDAVHEGNAVASTHLIRASLGAGGGDRSLEVRREAEGLRGAGGGGPSFEFDPRVVRLPEGVGEGGWRRGCGGAV